MFAVGKPSNNIQETYIKVYIEPGDTLWSIAKTYLPSRTDIRDYIHSIKKANQLDSSLIREGDYILVPVTTIQP
jgi:LysM repeat protein